MHVSTLRYTTFDSFSALNSHASTLDSLIDLYRKTFGDSGVWGESYSREDVLCKLMTELAGRASLRVCQSDDGEVVGFCWAQALDARAIARSIATIKYCQATDMPDMAPLLRPMIGSGRVIYVHDLGIAATHRGRVALTELIYPVIADVARRSGIDRVLFWSVADTLVSRFARRAAFDHRLTVHGMQFHLGQLELIDWSPGAPRLRWHAAASSSGCVSVP